MLPLVVNILLTSMHTTIIDYTMPLYDTSMHTYRYSRLASYHSSTSDLVSRSSDMNRQQLLASYYYYHTIICNH